MISLVVWTAFVAWASWLWWRWLHIDFLDHDVAVTPATLVFSG